MRFTNKYKLHVNLNVSTRRLPKSRLLKFRRPKWLKVKNTITNYEKWNPCSYLAKARKSFNLKKRLEKWKKGSVMKMKGSKKPLKKVRWITKYRKAVEKAAEKARYFSYVKEKYQKPFLKQSDKELDEESDKELDKESDEEPYQEPDFDRHEVPSTFMIRLENRFKDKLKMRKYLLSLFDNSIDFEIEKSFKMRKEIILHFLIKPYYRLDLLLWSLDCFRTSFESRQKITSKKIFVNGEIGKSNYFVKKGDIISFSSIKGKGKVRNNFIKNSECYLKNDCFFTFVEMDYYSNNIVILKDLLELSEDDFELLSEESAEVTEAYR